MKTEEFIMNLMLDFSNENRGLSTNSDYNPRDWSS